MKTVIKTLPNRQYTGRKSLSLAGVFEELPFLHKHAANVIGVLNGFDRLVFRVTLRRLVFLEGMKSYLWAANVVLKDFGEHVLSVTSLLKKASSEVAEKASRSIRYLPSSLTDKEKTARRIAEEDGIKQGLICVLTCVEPCVSFDIHRNRENKRLKLVTRHRKCLHVYHNGASLKFCRNDAGFNVFILPVDEPHESFGESVDELIFGFGIEPRKPFGFHDEPEAFDGVKIR